MNHYILRFGSPSNITLIPTVKLSKSNVFLLLIRGNCVFLVSCFSFSQTFHEVISFLYSFVTKIQEGDYDAEPKEESKVCYV